MNKIYLSPPNLNGKEWEFIKDALDSNWVAPLGPHVEAFEKELATLCQKPFAIAMNSGTSAIHIALILEDVKPEDFVFCSSLTFIGSANPIMYLGATPVFIDCDQSTWNMCPKALERAFDWAKKQNKLPKAVISVDLLGNPCDYDQILKICDHYQVPLIEDSAESLGASYHGKKCGSFGKYGILSFNGNKIITSSGGGALLVNDEALAQKTKFLITQARDPEAWYEHSIVGYNYRLSNICAALGRAQLTDLNERVAGRRKIFEWYQNHIEKDCVTFQQEQPNCHSNRWLTSFITKRTDAKEIIYKLNGMQIEARHMWKPLHTQPLFANCHYFSSEKKDIASEIFAKGVCLPSSQNLDSATLELIAKTVNGFLH
jgi:pyridoxal phosphate-dependent aminotransferase EpsN